MNAKDWIIYGVFTVILFICIIFGGCRTTESINDTELIERNSFYAGQLKSTVESLDRTIAGSTKRIENVVGTSRSIADGIERLEFLFAGYESEVARLLSEIERIRNQAEAKNADFNSLLFDIPCDDIDEGGAFNPGGQI